MFVRENVKMSEAVGFVGGAAILLDESRPLMNEINVAMCAIKQTVGEFDVSMLHFYIDGHTSVSKKSPDHGMGTSTARAKSVVDEMVLAGIPRWNLHARGFGDSKPLGGDKSANRRVDITVISEKEVALLLPEWRRRMSVEKSHHGWEQIDDLVHHQP